MTGMAARNGKMAGMLPQAPDAALARKPLAASRPLRWLWLLAGWLALLLGAVGVVTPLLPTVPFVLLAAACFSRGSARWEAWLLAHPRFGPTVRSWRERHAIPRRAKQLATLMMSLSCALAWWRAPAWAAALASGLCLLTAGWMWRQPDA
jgi:uncharacterized protein